MFTPREFLLVGDEFKGKALIIKGATLHIGGADSLPSPGDSLECVRVLHGHVHAQFGVEDEEHPWMSLQRVTVHKGREVVRSRIV